jgi:hypothetical protein
MYYFWLGTVYFSFCLPIKQWNSVSEIFMVSFFLMKLYIKVFNYYSLIFKLLSLLIF